VCDNQPIQTIQQSYIKEGILLLTQSTTIVNTATANTAGRPSKSTLALKNSVVEINQEKSIP
jgi:hypothetical protein